MSKAETLGKQMSELNFIGEEIQAFTGRFMKAGCLTKKDMMDLVSDLRKRVNRVRKITSDMSKEHLTKPKRTQPKKQTKRRVKS